MMVNCNIQYKDEILEIFLKETSAKFLIDNCDSYMYDANMHTHIFIISYDLWRFIIEILNKDGFKLTSKYFNGKGERII